MERGYSTVVTGSCTEYVWLNLGIPRDLVSGNEDALLLLRRVRILLKCVKITMMKKGRYTKKIVSAGTVSPTTRAKEWLFKKGKKRFLSRRGTTKKRDERRVPRRWTAATQGAYSAHGVKWGHSWVASMSLRTRAALEGKEMEPREANGSSDRN